MDVDICIICLGEKKIKLYTQYNCNCKITGHHDCFKNVHTCPYCSSDKISPMLSVNSNNNINDNNTTGYRLYFYKIIIVMIISFSIVSLIIYTLLHSGL